MLLSIYLIFWQFQSDVACKILAYIKKRVNVEIFRRAEVYLFKLFSIMNFRIQFNKYDLIWRISFEAAAKRKPYIIQKQPTEVIYKKKLLLKIS